LAAARAKAYSAVNFAMVEAYWLIGKQIVEAQAGNERAEYGTRLLKYLSEQLTRDFGKGFDESNLRLIRQFYLTFPIRDSARHELGWTHYRKIMKVQNKSAREFCIDECVRLNSGLSASRIESGALQKDYEGTNKSAQEFYIDECVKSKEFPPKFHKNTINNLIFRKNTTQK